MSLTQLQEKRGELVTQARSALDEITKNTDEARAAELGTRHDAIMAELDTLDASIAREERVAKAEAREEEIRAAKRPGNGEVVVPGQDDGAKPEYRDAFYAMIREGGDVSALSPEHRAALKAGVQSGAEFRAQTAGTTTAGGFTVPVTLAEFIVKSMVAWGPMYDDDLCTTINTTGGEQINIPTVNDTASTVGQHTEATALADTGAKDVVFGQKRLDAFVYDTEFIRWSLELSQDSIFNMEPLLGGLLGERLGRRANIELTTGDGTGDPNGIVTASTLGKTAAAAAAVTSDEIIDLLHSVNPAYRTSPKARFMFNDATLAVIRKLKDGQGNYLWQMGDVTTSQPGTLLGYRYSINQAMANVATAQKSMLFGDFSKYFVRKVGAPIIGVMRERFWPDLGIAGLIRLDGELADTAAVKHLLQA
jgi:HK97 family phage major capsid protein